MVGAGALVASLLVLGVLISVVRLTLIWWAVATNIGHRGALVLLAPVGLMVLLAATLAQIAKLGWSELRDLIRDDELAEQQELQNIRDDVELSQGKEEGL